MNRIAFVSSLLLAAHVVAQTSLFLPPEYERAWGRGSTALLGGNATRTQLVYAAPFAPGTVVTGIRFRPTTSNLDRAAFTASIQISCSSGPNVPGTLSTTFALNHGNDLAVVLPQQTVNIPAMPANRGTGIMATIPFATPFVYGLNGNTNLVVEVQVFSRSAGASWSTDRAFASTNGRVANHGIGCGAGTIGGTTTAASYVAGGTFNVTLANAPANAPALLAPSFDQKELLPGVLLAFNLGQFGLAPNCDALVAGELGTIGFTADALGAVSVPVPIPATASQFGIGFQWLYLVPPTAINPLGVEITAARSAWVGPEVCTPFYQYVWDLSSATVATGNATTNSIPVAELILQ